MDCLQREVMEEMGQPIDILSHYYTTDFFQKALFLEDTQLFSVYYLARFREAIRFKISDKPFDFDTKSKVGQSFRWVKLSILKPEDMTLPIDRKVLTMLLNERGLL